eukprot:scaffold8637_cov92-Cyclotella_meneghiniana.AAC.6
MEILGAIIVGRYLDDDKVDEIYDPNKKMCKRTRAKLCLGLFVIVNSIGNALAALQEYDTKRTQTPTAHDISSASVILPSLAFACWGFADAQIQVYSYWLIGGLYNTGQQHARAVGFYKLVQSLGTSIGFYFIPESRLAAMNQLLCSSIVFIAGSGLAFTQLPSQDVVE